jgi:RNA polymerase-binding transcription factor DksA
VYISYNYSTSPRRQSTKTQKHSQELTISLSSNETVCTKCGNEITDPSKRRKLFNVSTKTSACKNLLNLDSCLSNNVYRNCVDKNSYLLDLE